MSFGDIIYSVFIAPLQLLFEVIYTVAYRAIGHPGWAIIALSLAMNFLVLPLYKRADAMQEEARDVDAKLRDGVAHIKKTFSGDERMMILQAYYQQNNYKPTDALKGSVSLLLEIPFFMAAYQFLSHLGAVQGVSFGPITDLGAPDGLISIGGFTVNLLPVLMTLINVISSAIYLKGFPLKTKIQLYAMAGFFLVFLYTSPAGLVFYWTLNNLFSLVKTIFYKLKNPQKILKILGLIAGGGFVLGGVAAYCTQSSVNPLFLIIIGAALIVPISVSALLNALKIKFKAKESEENNPKMFFLGSLFLAVVVGALIPSAVIAASPQEFIDITYFHNPLWYVANSLCLAVGAFLVWMRVFYWISSKRGKVLFDKLIWVACGVTVLNYMAFGTDMGVLSSALQYENEFRFGIITQLVNIAVILALVAVMWIVIKYWKKVCSGVLLTAVIALGGMSVINVNKISASVSELDGMITEVANSTPHFTLNREGQNVVVIMLDRAMGAFVPYLFAESSELKEQFDGFTYYKNTITHGGFTNFGSPALYGGYEYTPIEMNRREDEKLVDKHNEALKVMPVLFDQNGYEVTVCDPTYANYGWVPDLSIYDEYPDINTYITEGAFDGVLSKQQLISNNKRNFFCFSVMKVMPVSLQRIIYNSGNYNKADNESYVEYAYQQTQGIDTAKGYKKSFMQAYNVLQNLPGITQIGNGEGNTFMMLANNTTHEPMLLQMPSYEPSYIVDNTKYNKEQFNSTPTIDGMTLKIENELQYQHYQINMAALKKLGNWFDYLREEGVYDNTRIIIVSDHGRYTGQIEEFILGNNENYYDDLLTFYPMLLVKDFDAEGFSTSEEFMTNADVPTLAVKDLIESPVNPFTNKPINNAQKTDRKQFVIVSGNWDTTTNNGNQYTPSNWYSVNGNLWDKNSWKFYPKVETIPKELR